MSNIQTLTAYDIIEKKRHRLENTYQEIDYMVSGYTKGTVPDYMMSAWLMAICMGGMSKKETFALTEIMMKSGDVISFDTTVVDKHSTGGVSDSTSLILVPILASVGVDVAKMSGRALGFTGGTIDKLEVFDGYKADVSQDVFKKLIKKNHGAIISQSAYIAPADKAIYALRDKTATVDSIPLIASSIMSKKLASGAKIILIDVKFGSGAFMKTEKDAIALAKLMVEIGAHFDRKMEAIVTNMDSPLGTGVGCVYEIKNVLSCLDNNSCDLLTLSKYFATRLVVLATNCDEKHAQSLVEDSLKTHKARHKFDEIISSLGGDIGVADNLPQSKYTYQVKAKINGYITHIDAYGIAKAVQHLVLNSDNKKVEGVELASISKKVNVNDVIATIHSNNKISKSTIEDIEKAITISSKNKKKKLIYKVIKGEK